MPGRVCRTEGSALRSSFRTWPRASTVLIGPSGLEVLARGSRLGAAWVAGWSWQSRSRARANGFGGLRFPLSGWKTRHREAQGPQGSDASFLRLPAMATPPQHHCGHGPGPGPSGEALVGGGRCLGDEAVHTPPRTQRLGAQRAQGTQQSWARPLAATPCVTPSGSHFPPPIPGPGPERNSESSRGWGLSSTPGALERGLLPSRRGGDRWHAHPPQAWLTHSGPWRVSSAEVTNSTTRSWAHQVLSPHAS